MPFLVRRIQVAKWQKILNSKNPNDSCADAITNCLRTKENTLSVWQIEDLGQLENAILALITSSQQTNLSTLNIVIIDGDTLQNENLEIVESEGDTMAKFLRDTHRDIANLTYSRLGKVKDIILNCLESESENYRIFTRKDLKLILQTAITEGKVDKDNLNQELLKDANINLTTPPHPNSPST